MSKIVRVETRPFRLALKGALQWGKASRLEALEHVLVAVTTDDGHEGIAEAPVRPTIYGETVASIEAIVRDHLAPRLLGLEVSNETAIQEALHSVAHNPCAKGALDIAWLDARAKAAGKTLFAAQRGPRERLRVSFILGIAEPDAMVAEARAVYEAGVRVFKVKVGRDAKSERRALQALRAAFAGADVSLYADANEALSPETAARDLARLAELGVAYVEEPLPVHLIKKRAALKAARILPIIADDACFTLAELERELDFDTFDILNIKPARTGFTESTRMLELARSAGKGVMVGSQASAGLGTLHAAIFASCEGVTHPSELSFPLKLEHDILDEPLTFEGGWLKLASLEARHLDRARLWP
jgi:L-alanine-DL-glutamate epimerase-like enolase superfamily enzyme